MVVVVVEGGRHFNHMVNILLTCLYGDIFVNKQTMRVKNLMVGVGQFCVLFPIT